MMVRDTAPYRYPYYHTADDRPDQVTCRLKPSTPGLYGVLVACDRGDLIAENGQQQTSANEVVSRDRLHELGLTKGIPSQSGVEDMARHAHQRAYHKDGDDHFNRRKHRSG